MPPITQQTVLITGASSGLGRELAVRLSKQDNHLVVTARREALLQSLAEEVRANGSRCTVVAADCTDPAQVKRVLDAGLETGGIDVAVLNAGGGVAMRMDEASAEDVLWIMRVNYDTMVLFLSPLIRHMKARGSGTIAYTGSPAGTFGLPKSGPYSAAKAAGRVLMDSARIELAGSGVKLVALYPGFTHTDALDPDDVPVKALIIDKERAAREMHTAIERGRAHHMFPKRIRLLIGLGAALPEWMRRFVLSRVG
jgi:short-subunit dehydrogenase